MPFRFLLHFYRYFTVHRFIGIKYMYLSIMPNNLMFKT